MTTETIATIAITVVGWIGTLVVMSFRIGRLSGELETLKDTARDHEARLRVQESGMSEIKADVKWIRQTLEQQGGR